MKEQEIKPCPYCGSTDIDYGKCLTNKTRTGKEFFVKCKNCGTEVNVSYDIFDETNLALEMWNNAKCACADKEKIDRKSTNFSQKDYEGIDFAIKALERQIPIKPIDVCTPVITWGLCPVCKGKLNMLSRRPNRVFKSNNFCPDCGQALDWSDEE